jgi:phospho-N-acetylmuramoyl-pentapeptide-transferase
MNSSIYLEISKILTYTAVAFIIAMWLAPSLISLLNWLKFWKKTPRDVSTTGEKLVITKQFYQENEKKRLIPRAGGILIWFTTLTFATFFWILLKTEPESRLYQFLNFISRKETFIPLGTLFFGSILGLIDDALVTMEHGGNYKAGGLRLSQRILFISLFSFVIGIWFYTRVNLSNLAFFGSTIDLNSYTFLGQTLAWLIIPITIVALVATWSTSIIDGLDGLLAGVMIPIYLCFSALAFSRQMYDVTTLLMVIVGCMAAYLWFNISPAKFFMGETGAVGILMTIAVVAIITDYLYLLPIAGLILYITTGSAVIQVFSKKVFKKKAFLVAPLHHYFEAIGWSRNQIVLRYWVVSWITSAIALAIGLAFR